MEMWIRRRLVRISWTERKNDEGILRIADEKRVLLSIVRSRSGNLIGHLMRRKQHNGIDESIDEKEDEDRGRHS